MGKIVAAVATVHAPQLFVRPPTEIPEQLDADIAAMRQIGKDIEEAKPDLAIVIGSDHLETFFLSSVPTFAVVAGETSHAHFANRNWKVPVHLPFADALLEKLMQRGFDMAYSQDAVLGHSFAAVYEWVIEGRKIPVVPLFVNTYLPPLPSPQRCIALGTAIAEIVSVRPERVALIASGGLSH
jgi:2,3-dihydroxyphenylpropionate 1,2-dioxygenase